MATNSLPTRDILNQRFETFNSSCALCGNELESICHLFFTCPIARAVWFESCWGFRTDSQIVQSSDDIIKLILAPPPTTTTLDVESWYVSSAMTFVVDRIWNSRNKAIFQGKKFNICEACLQIQGRSTEFCTIIQAANQAHRSCTFILGLETAPD
nr:hypothetical protein CFP56_25145 [Quercus suber]